jgi:hypothetical protein
VRSGEEVDANSPQLGAATSPMHSMTILASGREVIECAAR